MIRLRKEIIQEAGLIPRGYGIAWRCYRRHAVVCYPIPLNVILASLRSLWLNLQHWESDNAFDRATTDAYVRGRFERDEADSRAMQRIEKAAYERGKKDGVDEFLTTLREVKW